MKAFYRVFGIGALAAFCLLPVAGDLVAQHYAVGIGRSSDTWVFRKLALDEPKRGDLVSLCLFDLDHLQAVVGVPRGTCLSGFVPLFKRVAAVAGDHVAVDDRGVRVNGQLLEETEPEQSVCWHVGCTSFEAMLPPKTYLVLSENRELGFDSRYFGPLPLSHMQHRLEPVW